MFLFAVGVKPESGWVWFFDLQILKRKKKKKNILIKLKYKLILWKSKHVGQLQIHVEGNQSCCLKGSNRNQTKMLILVNRINHFHHLTKPLQVTSITSFCYLVPTTKGEGRNIVCVRIPSVLASWLFIVCILSPEQIGGVWPNLHRHIIGREERSEDFGDNDLIFKVIPALWNFHKKKACLHPIFWSKWRILTKINIYCNVCMDSRFN